MGSALPFRIDRFGDEIETIKTFDVDSQRTLYPVRDVRLLPAREFPLDETRRARFRTRFREVFEGDPFPIAAVQGHQRAASCPAASSTTCRCSSMQLATFAEYLPENSVVALHGDVRGAVDHFWQDTESRWKLMRGDKARPLLPPHELFLPVDTFNGVLKPFRASASPRLPIPSRRTSTHRCDDCLRCKSSVAPTTRSPPSSARSRCSTAAC